MTSARRTRALFAVLLLLCLAPAVPSSAQDKKHEAQLRTVRGAVVDPGDNPLSSAVVYLKNLKTLEVKTYISEDTGQYRFSGLDSNVDYQVRAEHGELTSAPHTVSSFDSRKEIVITLKVNKKKSGK